MHSYSNKGAITDIKSDDQYARIIYMYVSVFKSLLFTSCLLDRLEFLFGQKLVRAQGFSGRLYLL